MVEHGGNIDGMHAQVSLVPELELGMIFLSNSRNLMPEAARYHIVEIFANVEHQKDWGEHFLKVIEKAENLSEKSLNNIKQSRNKKTKPSLPLDHYAGIYSHPMYGDIKVVQKK